MKKFREQNLMQQLKTAIEIRKNFFEDARYQTAEFKFQVEDYGIRVINTKNKKGTYFERWMTPGHMLALLDQIVK